MKTEEGLGGRVGREVIGRRAGGPGTLTVGQWFDVRISLLV